jgi:hypothetical protein
MEREKRMLCATCAGTSYSEYNQCLKYFKTNKAVPVNTEAVYISCKDCYGQGVRLIREGNCSHCGSTILHWQRCLACLGSGKITVISPIQRKKVRKQINAVKITT